MNLVCEHHEPPVGFSSQDTPNTLSRISHCIEAEELRLAYPIGVTEILQSGFQYTTFRILVWDPNVDDFDGKLAKNASCLPKHDDSPSIVVIEIDAFGHFASCDRKEDCSSSVIASLHEYQ
jgi:hypothetical protein